MYKKIVFAFLFSAICLFTQAQSGLFLYAQWDDNTLPIASPGNLNVQYSGCWGMAVNGREYAVLGGAAHVLIFDMTNPAETFLKNKFDGAQNTVWREFKSYKNRLYAVSDATTEGLMIFDFSQAPDTIVRTYWSSEFFERAHTITLDTVSGHIYLNGGSSGGGITILDVSQNPDQPQLLAKIPQLPGGYIHDSYVRNDTLYASSGFNGLYIYDFKSDIQNPKLITSISTGGYNHNSWLTTDGRYAYYTEEIPDGRPIQIVDLQNLAITGEVELVGNGFLDNLTPGGTEAIPHNVYIKDNFLFNSQYEDGLLVYDISQPESPVLLSSFDTHPQNNVYNGYYGNWGNYPWLPSGTIVAGDMQNGLSILGFQPPSSTSAAADALSVQVLPNPATDQIFIRRFGADQDGRLHYRLLNAQGSLILEGHKNAGDSSPIHVTSVPVGMYLLEVQIDQKGSIVKKLAIH